MLITQALTELAPNAKWTIENDDLTTLDWKSPDIPIPDEQEIDEKIAEIAAREAIEQPLRILRLHRDELLRETDWWAVSDRVMTQAQITYRQALRDLPSSCSPALDAASPLGISGVTWPVKPE